MKHLGVLLQSVTWEQPQQMKPKVQPLRYLHPSVANSKRCPLEECSLGGACGASLSSHSQQVAAPGCPGQWWYP